MLMMIVVISLLLAIACVRVAGFEIDRLVQQGKSETIDMLAEDREGIPGRRSGGGTRNESPRA